MLPVPSGNRPLRHRQKYPAVHHRKQTLYALFALESYQFYPVKAKINKLDITSRSSGPLSPSVAGALL